MQIGRYKVYEYLNYLWQKFRLNHLKDGKVVKEGGDLMAATRCVAPSSIPPDPPCDSQWLRRSIMVPFRSLAEVRDLLMQGIR